MRGLGHWILGSLAALLVTLGAGWAIKGQAQQVTYAEPEIITGAYVPDISAAPLSRAELSFSFAPVVKQATPAVVSIYTKTLVTPRFRDPLSEMLFGRRFGAPREETGLGSGVIVGEDGVIVTNAHVIERADQIVVALKDRREFTARVLLTDPKTDLAVLKIDAAGLPSLRFRNSDTLEVGDLVLAIGNPFGVGQTVTSGIVSAKTRTTPDGGVFLQTDAAINPGNSGGALVDMTGQIVGINTMILSPSGGSNGIGFAIPSSLARQAVESAVDGSETVARAWIGAQSQSVTQEIADSLGLARPEGVILAELHPRSSIGAAGLSTGDVILRVDGQPVNDPTALRYRLTSRSLGDSAQLTYLRDGQEFIASVTLDAAPEDPPRQTTALSGRNPLSGAVIANINPALAEETGIESSESGVIVMEIVDGYAGRFGLRPGDILRAVNGRPVGSVNEVDAELRIEAGRWEVVVERGGRLLRMRAG